MAAPSSATPDRPVDHVFYHLGFGAHQLAESPQAVLLSGDPGRTTKIADRYLTDATCLSTERGLTSWFGYTASGTPVLASTSGMGAPSMSIVVNELVQIGVDTIIRIGTTGGIQPKVELGSVVVSSSALCLQGAADDIAPPRFPAAADPWLTVALAEAARSLSVPCHVGVTASVDTFYEGQERTESSAAGIQPHLVGRVDEFARLGILNIEMEAGTLFKMGLVYGFRAGCVAGVIANRMADEHPDLEVKAAAVDAAIRTAIATADSLPIA